MGSMFKLILSVSIFIFSLHKESDALSMYNVPIQRQPQKAVEIIEVTVPQNAENPYRSTGDIKEFHTLGEPRYEILIKPSKNTQNSAGGRKIKIFVASEDYSNEKQSSENSSSVDVNQQKSQPIPLTINAAGLNVDTFQYSKPDTGNSIRNIKQIAHESNNRSKQNNGIINTQKSDSKTVHTLRDIPEQVTVYSDDYISQQNEEREKRNKLRSNSDRDLVLNTKPVEEFRSSHVPVTAYKADDPQVYRSVLQKQSKSNPYVGVTERHRGTPFDDRSSHNRGVGVEKALVFEPNAGISVTNVSSVYLNHSHTQTVRPTHDLDYNRTSTRPGRGYTNVDEERADHSFLAKNPGRNVEGQSSYHAIQPAENKKHTNSEYSSGTTTYNLPNERGRSEERYSPVRKTVHGPRENYPYAEETEYPSLLSTGLPYETTQSNTGGRTARENSYGGFPESYSPNAEEFSKPNGFGLSHSPAISQCQNVLKYTLFESDRWYAEISITTDEVLVGMRLDIILDGLADLMTAVSSEVRSHDNIHFTILSLKKRLLPGKPERVQIMVKYNADDPSTPVPHVKTIDLNGRMICPGRTHSYPQVTTSRRPVYVHPSEEQEHKRTTERNPDLYNRPAIVNEYPSVTRRTTPKPVSTKRITSPTDYELAPNPDFYEKPNQNRITTSKPVPNRPLHVDNKPSVPSGNDSRRPSTEIHGINPSSNSANNNNNSRPNDKEKRKIPCGKPAVQPRPLITNGQKTTRGQWPWHAALYKTAVSEVKYICGGSLVTENHIITAAHCATVEPSSIPIDPSMLLVYLGKYNLKAWTEHGGLSRDVSRVTIHPDFNSTNFRADIAVLTLARKVEFTDFIRPVCLWDKRNTLISDIIGLEGTVVGWGFDETKHLTEELKQAQMPVVAQDICLWSYPQFFPRFTHNNTYCAGFKNGTSVCNGDSGGGMFFPIKINNEERWFLRGLVSLSVGDESDRVCDIRHYVVFADTAKYLPWLEDVLFRVRH